MAKQAKKISAAAGIIVMAEWMGRTMGKNKKDEEATKKVKPETEEPKSKKEFRKEK